MSDVAASCDILHDVVKMLAQELVRKDSIKICHSAGQCPVATMPLARSVYQATQPVQPFMHRIQHRK